MQQTQKEVFNLENSLDLMEYLQIPKNFQDGLVKCRILYSSSIEKIEFHPYQIRPINNLKVIYNDQIDYTYKSEDRTTLTQLFQQREIFDDIIIVKNGLVTDSYYANLVFDDGVQLFTPRLPLLRGIQRAKLLEAQSIQEADIRLEDFPKFEQVHLINAMMGLGECVVKIKNVR
ncbi:MAG: aminotransferase class IV [Bacteroidota bacterium]